MAVRRKLVPVLVVLLSTALVSIWLSTIYGGTTQLWKAPEGSINWSAEENNGDPITVRIGTSRNAGYRIGDIIAIHVVVVADEGVPVDLSNLYQGNFIVNGNSDFELADPPQVSKLHQHGKTIYAIALDVRSWKVTDTIDFSVDIQYATRDKDGTESWTTIESPTETVQTTRSARKDDEFDQGNRGAVPLPSNPLGHTFVFLGVWLLLCMFVWSALRLFPRVRQLKPVSPNVKAWRVFDAVFADAQHSDWGEEHYIRISATLRQFMGVEAVALDEMSATLAEHPHADTAIRVFTLLEGALYAQRVLGSIERAQLQTDLETLVPRQ
jgi:hypothetical protein